MSQNLELNPQSTPSQPRGKATDRVNFKSHDGLVEVHTKVKTARRYPPHDYPVVCLRLRPRAGSRIQRLEDEEGLDVLLTHEEVSAHIAALNEADPKAGYAAPVVPAKPAERKRQWDERNARRHAERRQKH